MKEFLDDCASADIIMGLVEQHLALNKISMKENECPKTLFSQITMITQKFEGRGASVRTIKYRKNCGDN